MSAWKNVVKPVKNILNSSTWLEIPGSSAPSKRTTTPATKLGKNGYTKKGENGIPPFPHVSGRWTHGSTAFLIYLLDCGHVLFFGDRPRVAPYELRHSLPAHEHVYEARTAFEWQIASTATNQAEYPVLLEMLLSPQIERHPSDISVFGNFLLLHGTNPFPRSLHSTANGN